ncbi:hypothetical protein AVEN_224977-1 [Araneus ventricosus]|uniref:Uncharacterized protein n=1 Tax=Araneus ventricosus TaxID=182803 RepID=A0A4Y2PW64_ARAVE|nr:hypothetical protein AVEN_224977-1 [Araneus ventricosus]
MHNAGTNDLRPSGHFLTGLKYLMVERTQRPVDEVSRNGESCVRDRILPKIRHTMQAKFEVVCQALVWIESLKREKANSRIVLIIYLKYRGSSQNRHRVASKRDVNLANQILRKAKELKKSYLMVRMHKTKYFIYFLNTLF